MRSRLDSTPGEHARRPGFTPAEFASRLDSSPNKGSVVTLHDVSEEQNRNGRVHSTMNVIEDPVWNKFQGKRYSVQLQSFHPLGGEQDSVKMVSDLNRMITPQKLYKGTTDIMSDLSLPKINAGNYSNGEPLSNFLDISLTKKRIQKAIHRQAESSCDSHY